MNEVGRAHLALQKQVKGSGSKEGEGGKSKKKEEIRRSQERRGRRKGGGTSANAPYYGNLSNLNLHGPTHHSHTHSTTST